MADSAIHSINYGSDNYTFTLPYGVCNTTAETVAKTVTVQNFSLEPGARIIIKFTYANSATKPTLNVNGTGAKSIMRYGTTNVSTGTTTTGWIAGAIQAFTYDGTNWVQDYWNNTTYSNAALGQGYATCATAAATAAKAGSLSSYKLVTGGIVSVKFTYAVPASATLNINSTGAKNIYYRGAAITADVIKAGDIATFIYSSQYHLISIDRWQNDITSLQAQLDSKQATISGGASTITSSNLTTNRALISNGSGKVAVSAVTSTELGYLGGVTSNVQTQLDEIKNTKPDWNQMDETAFDYVKNRTHYDGVKSEILADKTSNWTTISSGKTAGNFALIEGQEYKVVFDGVSYLLTATYVEAENTIILGEWDNIDANYVYSTIPFCISYSIDDSKTRIWVSTIGSHSYTIILETKITKQLDPKYLPDSVPYAEITEEILGERTATWTLADDKKLGNFELIENQIYKIIYDDTTYHLAAYRYGGILIIGTYDDSTQWYDFSDIPFAISCTDGDGASCAAVSTAGEHSFKVSIETETVHKLDPKYLPDSVPYTEGSGDVLFEKTVALSRVGRVQRITDVNTPNILTVGNTYTVIWDSVKYIETCGLDNDGYPYIGAEYDTTIEDWDFSVKPFCVYYSNEGNALYFITDNTDQHTIVIMDGVIHQLDEKYIPDEIPRMKDIPYTEGSGEVLFDGTVSSATNGSVFNFNMSSSIIEGVVYTVVFNGTKYCDVARVEYDMVIIGDYNLTNFPFVVYMSDGVARLSFTPSTTATVSIIDGVIHQLDEKYLPESVDGVIIRSSTEGSTKKFKLTVNDSGTITATEV